MNNYCILATSNHPLFYQLKDLGAPFYESPPESFPNCDMIFDFTITSLEKKEEILKSLSKNQTPIISELGPYWAEDLMKRYPVIKGALAASFPSLQKKVEVYCPCEKSMSKLKEFLKYLDITPWPMDEAGVGFYYPRILSLIINEAYFAKHENLAQEDAIDTAMKYGVNYPQGPFEWAKKIGTFTIALLLKELFRATKDPRYHPAPALIEESEGKKS